jgi:opacity protein-like surface antigen
MLAPNLTAKLEYLYVRFNQHGVFDDTFPGGGVLTENIGSYTNIVRAGVNYKFGWAPSNAVAY